MFDTTAANLGETLADQQILLVGEIHKALQDLMYEHRSFLRPSLLKRVRPKAKLTVFSNFCKLEKSRQCKPMPAKVRGRGWASRVRCVLSRRWIISAEHRSITTPQQASLWNAVRTYSDAYIEAIRCRAGSHHPRGTRTHPGGDAALGQSQQSLVADRRRSLQSGDFHPEPAKIDGGCRQSHPYPLRFL